MQNGHVITIGTLGLSGSEVTVLKSISAMTLGRKQGGYEVHPGADVDSCDIVIVNEEDEEATLTWRTLTALPHPPVFVLYTKTVPADPAQQYLLRPIGPTKVLLLLDSIANKMRESAQVWKSPTKNQAPQANTEPTHRALVVDDSPTVCRQLELELGNFNIEVDIAKSGERGLEMLALHQYDLILLDVVLPGTDGYQVCKEIRKNPKTKQTPVIMLTSKSSPFDRVRGSLVGCSAYLTKPVDYTAFRETVEKYVKAEAAQ